MLICSALGSNSSTESFDLSLSDMRKEHQCQSWEQQTTFRKILTNSSSRTICSKPLTCAGIEGLDLLWLHFPSVWHSQRLAWRWKIFRKELSQAVDPDSDSDHLGAYLTWTILFTECPNNLFFHLCWSCISKGTYVMWFIFAVLIPVFEAKIKIERGNAKFGQFSKLCAFPK